MVGRKNIRARGKISLSKYFQELKNGDSVAVCLEQSVPATIPKRLQGRTGVIEGRKGKAYILKLKDQNQEKRYLIKPIHLKKLE